MPDPQTAARGFSDHVAAFSKLLIALRRAHGRDLDQMLILAVIAERHFAAQSHKGAPINALSVAQYSGIPRETVRRKIKQMLAKGWLEADATGALTPTPKAAADLAEGTAATRAYLAQIEKS